MRYLPSRPAATFGVLVVATTAFALLQAMVIPVLPEIRRALHTDARSVTWVVSGYLLSAAIATPILGRLGDAVGKKPMLVAALGMLAAGSLGAALAPGIGIMTAARVLQGAGGAVMPLAFGIVRDEFPAERVPSAIGVLAAISGIGASAGLVLAGPIVDALGYRWLFLLPMLMIAATAVVAVFVVPASAGRAEPISWAPAPFLAGALATFVLATTEASRWGWASGRTLGLYAVAAALAAGWLRLESRARHPLIDLKMMRIPAIRSGNAVSFLLGFAMFAVYAFVPQLLQAPSSTGYGVGATVTESGLLMLPLASAVFVGGLVTAGLVRRNGSRRVVVSSSVVIAGCLAVVAWGYAATWQLVTTLGVYGVALGVALASLATLVVVSAPPSQSAVAGAVNLNARNVGGSVGTAVMATVVTARLDASGAPVGSGYTAGFVLLAVAMALATALAVAIPRPAAEPAGA
ncbi:MFS transporter [Dactylosporangium sp. AC04546]|uniref:MFS transporter n=1 Tax=Dactylosporangium sp. AC04546 TaxID=2862460 RepID=UPI001EDE3D2B|nr:MFS transporter [Dactylosporangium sp. AC04546]WVK87247.1 MFS transporter [Dactylosporangium sp. AC04546]